MTSEQLKAFRKRHGFTQAQLAEVIEPGYGRKPTESTVGRWEAGTRPVPDKVAAYLEALDIELVMQQGGEQPGPQRGDGGRFVAGEPGDTEPGPTEYDTPQFPLASSNAYTRACTELFEIIAAGIGMTGAAIQSNKTVAASRVLDQDKHDLGRAYGRLAETNETFRRMLAGAVAGGAWTQVMLASGSTAARMWRAVQETDEGQVRLHVVPGGAEGSPEPVSAS